MSVPMKIFASFVLCVVVRCLPFASASVPGKDPTSENHRCSSSEIMFTTNKEDQEEAAKLKERLANQRGASSKSSSSTDPLPNVSIDEGAHKYVLIRAKENDGKNEHFVVSKREAHYHRNVAEPMVDMLQRHGYEDIQILGGGRIRLDSQAKKVDIFGFSHSFGQPDHSISRKTVMGDRRFKDYEVATSNGGY